MALPEEIKRPVADDLSRYEQYMRDCLRSENHLVQQMLDYIFSTRGKAVRPLMAILTARMLSPGQQAGKDTLTAAMLLEMIHTASLIHDDVIDEAAMRRGKASVKALWDSHRAVLIGDYLLAKGFGLGMQSGAHEMVGYISGAMNLLCEGELIQTDHSQRLDMSREVYYDIIRKKTGILFAVSSGSGAMSVGAPPETVRNAALFGEYTGMAFQIMDDILDFTSSEKTGKPKCADVRERKITLPLLAVMEQSNQEQNRHIISLIAGIDNQPANAETILEIVKTGGGMEIAYEVMSGFTNRALEILRTFPENEFRSALEKLCLYLTRREN